MSEGKFNQEVLLGFDRVLQCPKLHLYNILTRWGGEGDQWDKYTAFKGI